jgi:hypothetical protein
MDYEKKLIDKFNYLKENIKDVKYTIGKNEVKITYNYLEKEYYAFYEGTIFPPTLQNILSFEHLAYHHITQDIEPKSRAEKHLIFDLKYVKEKIKDVSYTRTKTAGVLITYNFNGKEYKLRAERNIEDFFLEHLISIDNLAYEFIKSGQYC